MKLYTLGGVGEFFKSAVFLEGEGVVLGDDGDTHIPLMLFFYHIHDGSADFFVLIIESNKKIMHIGVLHSVVHNAYHSNELISVPGRINLIKIFNCRLELFREMT